MEFKDRLRELRNDSETSVLELAKRLNKSESAIRMWEAGKAKPDADTLIKLSNLFECTTDYLLGLSSFKNIAERDKLEVIEFYILEKLNELPGSRGELVTSLGDFIDAYVHIDSKKQYSASMTIRRLCILIREYALLMKRSLSTRDELITDNGTPTILDEPVAFHFLMLLKNIKKIQMINDEWINDLLNNAIKNGLTDTRDIEMIMPLIDD